MKLSVAAAAIAFSGTAFIMTPTAAAAAQQDMKPQTTAKAGWDDAGMSKASAWADKGTSAGGKLQAMGGPLEEAPIKAGMGAEFASADVDGKFDTADMDVGAKFASADLNTGEMETGAKFAQAGMHMGAMDVAGKSHEGMGGPEEDIASAKQASGRDSSVPVETAAVSKEATASGAAIGQGKEAYAGMGGPEEASTEYPPCSPGPGDDRCIQLYERGVGGGSTKRA